MTAIVMNTLNGAVTEYDWAFQSITPTHAGDTTGLFELGGDDDAGQDIDATYMTGQLLWGSTLKKFIEAVYFAITGSGDGTLLVEAPDKSYSYDFLVRPGGESRAEPGRGIRENYLAFGFANKDGADFRIDRMELLIYESKTRRI